jgi:hypothetical protein
MWTLTNKVGTKQVHESASSTLWVCSSHYPRNKHDGPTQLLIPGSRADSDSLDAGRYRDGVGISHSLHDASR